MAVYLGSGPIERTTAIVRGRHKILVSRRGRIFNQSLKKLPDKPLKTRS